MKKILPILSAFFFLGIVVYFSFFYTHTTTQRNINADKVTYIEPSVIIKDFLTNESTANTKYLNKTVEVKGKANEINKDAFGNTTIVFKNDSSSAKIFCTLKVGETIQFPKDSIVAIKGICTGFLSDVVINEAMIVK